MRAGVVGLALLLGFAIAVWLIAWNYPYFDTYVHLTWGRDLLDGLSPGFDSDISPTERPLWLLASVVLVLVFVFGDAADHAMRLLVMLSWAAMVAGTYRLAAVTTGGWVGALAAALLASSATFL